MLSLIKSIIFRKSLLDHFRDVCAEVDLLHVGVLRSKNIGEPISDEQKGQIKQILASLLTSVEEKNPDWPEWCMVLRLKIDNIEKILNVQKS